MQKKPDSPDNDLKGTMEIIEDIEEGAEALDKEATQKKLPDVEKPAPGESMNSGEDLAEKDSTVSVEGFIVEPQEELNFVVEPGRDLLKRAEEDPEKKPSDKGYVRAFANYTQIAFTIAAAIIIAVFIGRFLDDLLGTSPWLLLLFSFLGIGAALRSAFNITKK